MKIALEEAEINLAVIAYAKTQINIAEDQDIEVSFTAGRGANGLTADLSITTPSGKSAGVAAATPKKVAKATVTKTEPEPETEKPEEAAEEESEEEEQPQEVEEEKDDEPTEAAKPRAGKSLFAKAS